VVNRNNNNTIIGKEKEGIPVEFIHLLDECIEIPQLGIIRSLNVHVSASVLIWEYTRQHTMMKAAKQDFSNNKGDDPPQEGNSWRVQEPPHLQVALQN